MSVCHEMVLCGDCLRAYQEAEEGSEAEARYLRGCGYEYGPVVGADLRAPADAPVLDPTSSEETP